MMQYLIQQLFVCYMQYWNVLFFLSLKQFLYTSHLWVLIKYAVLALVLQSHICLITLQKNN